jgi:DNA-binding LytR/AlgR family response regulator
MFLDINMPKMTGVEFLKTAAELPITVITTAYAEFAVEGFNLSVTDYLVKPFSFERFFKACNKAREYYELQQQKNKENSAGTNYFFVKSEGRIEKILYDELVYVQAMQNYIVLHTTTKKLVVYHTLKGIEEQLPADIFVKIHKSTIINSHKIKSIMDNEIDLGSAKTIISQGLQQEVIKTILKDKMLKR